MTILIAYASKHGSTREIAEAVRDELAAMQIAAEVRDIAVDPDPGGYQAVLLGSAIYMGKWMKEADQYAEGHRHALVMRPLWLFSSGPVGSNGESPALDPEELSNLMSMTNALSHTLFSGKLDSHELGLGERLVARVVNVPEGDFRNWNEIRDWAREIGVAYRITHQAAAS